VQLYFADGWIQVSLTTAWSLAMFQALGGCYDSFGGTLSVVALAGAAGGMVLGRYIDLGHARRVIWINAATLAAVLRAIAGGSAPGVVAVAVATTLVGGFYLPVWMAAVYNEAKIAPCPFRFQIAAEAGWDLGGALAGISAAAFCWFGFPLATAILLALPMVLVQALWLDGSYRGAAKPPACLKQRQNEELLGAVP
jgi:hypothetical protein